MATKKQPIIDIEIMRGPIYTAWNAIGNDYLELGPCPNACAIEASIDANRLTQFAYGEKAKAAAEAAEAEVERAIKAHGYEKVLKALSHSIKLT